MKLQQWKFEKVLSGVLSAALVLTGAPLGAATIQECAAGKPTSASQTWNFKSEADNLFQQLETRARQTMDRADQLRSMARNPDTDWQIHAGQLQQVKMQVNDTAEKLCRLETIRRVLAPWQQKTVDQIARQVQLMADNAQDAIAFLDANRGQLWSPTYGKYLSNVYNQAQDMTRSTENAVEYAEVQQQYNHLQKEIGVTKS